MRNEYRVVDLEYRGTFAVFGEDLASAQRRMEGQYQFWHGETGNLGTKGKLQSRPFGTHGDDSTWTDVSD